MSYSSRALRSAGVSICPCAQTYTVGVSDSTKAAIKKEKNKLVRFSEREQARLPVNTANRIFTMFFISAF